jgi:tetratricopeptide (TPR) repeat protein
LDTARRVETAYPDNVINLQVLGRVEMYNKLYKDAEESFGKVLKLSPKNQRVHYYLARLYMKQKKYTKAEKKINLYLKFDLDDYQKGYAYYYKGHILMRQKKYSLAAETYDLAWKVNKVDGAKDRAERARKMEKKKKAK